MQFFLGTLAMQVFRQQILLFLSAFYLVPIFLLAFYAAKGDSFAQKGWLILSLGLVLAAFGLIFIFLKLVHWQKEWLEQEKLLKGQSLDKMASDAASLKSEKEQEEFHQTTLEAYKKEWDEKERNLSLELDEKKMHLQDLEKRNQALETEIQQVLTEAEENKQKLQRQIDEASLTLKASEQMIQEQQALLEKRQQEIAHLENQIQDLTYEVKTLIHLAKLESSEDDSKEPS